MSAARVGIEPDPCGHPVFGTGSGAYAALTRLVDQLFAGCEDDDETPLCESQYVASVRSAAVAMAITEPCAKAAL